MNLNDVLAQQQQIVERAQQTEWAYLAISGAFFILGCFVIWAFHERLRDIGDELRKFRIAYEFANTPAAPTTSRRHATTASDSEANPFRESFADSKYTPK